MGKWKHRLSNINSETRTADCEYCGPQVPLRRHGSKSKNVRWTCRTAWAALPSTKKQQDKFRASLAAHGLNPSKSGGHKSRHGYRDWREVRKSKLEAQGGVCAICGTSEPTNGWHQDHDHKSKKRRGVLCGFCNVMLGFARENELVLVKAAIYLKKYKDPTSSEVGSSLRLVA